MARAERFIDVLTLNPAIRELGCPARGGHPEQSSERSEVNPKTRTEADSFGPMEVPAEALYGAQTARAVRNFPISGLRFPRSFIRALGLIKKHAARVNTGLGRLPDDLGGAIEQAAQEVLEGAWDDQFVVDIFQTGSGTSTHMNANEVVARRATQLLAAGDQVLRVHPNDHVNRGQSSNDVMPSALHIAAMEEMQHGLIPALRGLEGDLRERAAAFAEVLKIGRTHLQDATPMRVGQELGGHASQVAHGLKRIERAGAALDELPLGGTAVGTGLNTHPDFARLVIEGLARETGLNLREAEDHFEAQSVRDAWAEVAGLLKTVALSLAKIANDLRWLGSGPRCGLGELRLPASQPGSSIMPGKVNPVMCEMLLQVAVQIAGNETVISQANLLGSNFQLNVMLPVMAHNLLQAIDLLTRASRTFSERCVKGLEVDAARCAAMIEQSLAMATALTPVVGYDAAARIAHEAHVSGRTVREVAREMAGLEAEELARLLEARSQTEPSR